MSLYSKLVREGEDLRRPSGHVTATAVKAVRDAAAARDRAMTQVTENADTAWRSRALEAVRRTAELRAEFIVDDVWDVGGLESTREDRALGPVMLAARRAGWIRKTDRVRPSVRSHLSGKPVWLSLIHNDSNNLAVTPNERTHQSVPPR